MTDEEIRSNLCAYDPRNPNYYYDEVDEEVDQTKKKNTCIYER